MPLTARQRARLAAVLDPLEKGDYLVAFDRAQERLDRQPGDRLAQYLAVLALARAGATARAQEQLESSGLSSEQPDGLREDVAALRARLAKHRALEADHALRRTLAQDAATLYEDAARIEGGSAYCSVNAATMWLVAGEPERSEAIALAVLRDLDGENATTSEGRYWQEATRAEAALLLGHVEDAGAALLSASRSPGSSVGNRAVTRRQLSIVCAVRDLPPAVLEGLPVPDVIHYCGHLTGAHRPALDQVDEPSLVAAVDRFLDERQVGYGYGSLASGADILVAESLLARQAELTVVLPFALDEFIATSVEPAGPGWTERFHRCLSGARHVLYGTEDEFLGDTALFDYCAQIAMGQAVMRAAYLGATAQQLALWDGRPAEGVGTSANVQAWRTTGLHTTVIPWPGQSSRKLAEPTITSGREIRAVLFCDIKGFSALRDRQIRAFLRAVMAPLGETLDEFSTNVLYRNTWGDGLYLVLSSVSSAADCALALQETMQRVDLAGAGLPQDLGLRIGAHAGPVFEGADPIRHEAGYFGAQVNRTARIEPRTPEGAVYASAAFAALAALDSQRRFSCEYVGHIPLAKDYGRHHMYVLKRRPESSVSHAPRPE